VSDTPVIVAVGAHAADLEFTAGATLAKHVQAGWRGHIVNFTLGEKGSATLSPHEYAAQKLADAEACASVLGVTHHFLGERDGELMVDEVLAARLARLLRELQPDVVLTHWRHSMHSDHEACHHLVRRAIFLAAIRHFEIDGLPPKFARCYYADNWEDEEGFSPYLFVDISDVFEQWREAFHCFAIGRGEGGYPYWEQYEARTRLHGIRIGVRYAQAFAVEERQKLQVRTTL